MFHGVGQAYSQQLASNAKTNKKTASRRGLNTDKNMTTSAMIGSKAVNKERPPAGGRLVIKDSSDNFYSTPYGVIDS